MLSSTQSSKRSRKKSGTGSLLCKVLLLMGTLFFYGVSGGGENSSVQTILEKESLEQWVQNSSKQKVLASLMSYTLPDTIEFNGGLKNIWYMKFAEPDSLQMYRDFALLNNEYYASYRLKALYWMWLIHEGKENLCHKPARLVNTTSKDTLFDYVRDGVITERVEEIESVEPRKKKSKRFQIKPFSVHYQGRVVKETQETIVEVEALYRDWIEIVEREGLQGAQQHQEPLLQNKYQWVVIE